MNTLKDWHRRYCQQAVWTASLRRYALEMTGGYRGRRILEVGCGTGAVTASLFNPAQPGRLVAGLDLDLPSLHFARANDSHSRFTCGDALRLPFAEGAFDACICHFLLLWLSRPQDALAEMVRVTRPGGWVLALAEPDYGGRLDAPAPLETLGKMQTEALRAQGADPFIGRRLNGLMADAGLVDIQGGVIGANWNEPPSGAERESEWAVLAADLEGRIAPQELARLRQIDEAAWRRGSRTLFVPTLYAWGKRPS